MNIVHREFSGAADDDNDQYFVTGQGKGAQSAQDDYGFTGYDAGSYLAEQPCDFLKRQTSNSDANTYLNFDHRNHGGEFQSSSAYQLDYLQSNIAYENDPKHGLLDSQIHMDLLSSNAYGQGFSEVFGDKEIINQGLPCDPSQTINAGSTIRQEFNQPINFVSDVTQDLNGRF